MCGRYSFTTPEEAARGFFRYSGTPLNFPPRYNIAPTQTVATVRAGEAGRELAMMKWGLVPFWAKDTKIAYKTINARVETVAAAPAFRAAFKARRCLILADGFYEWKPTGPKTKQPYRFVIDSGSPFAFAGLWETWDKGEAPLTTCTIITGEPNSVAAPIHDRMPVILDPTTYDAWLSGTAGREVLTPFPADRMRAYLVSTRVGNVRNDDAAIIEELNSA